MSSVDFLADLGPSADVRAVARVLSAAAAPPWPHELRGYESARRAFENAGSAGNIGKAGSTGATPVRHSYAVPLRRLLGVKLAAVAGALSVTGVAVAAEADVLPSPIQRAAHQVLGGVGVPEPDPAERTGQSMASSPDSSSGQLASPDSVSSNRASGGRSGGGSGGSGSGSSSSGGGSGVGVLPGTPSGTADTDSPPGQSPSMPSAADVVALCRAYIAHKGAAAADGGNGAGNSAGNGDGNANGNGNGGLNAHDRRRLTQLAGGADRIDAFCARVLASASTGGPVIPQPTNGPTKPSVTPDPSHGHKPATSPSTPGSSGSSTPGSSSSPGWNPATSSTGDGGGSGPGHAPGPPRSGH